MQDSEMIQYLEQLEAEVHAVRAKADLAFSIAAALVVILFAACFGVAIGLLFA